MGVRVEQRIAASRADVWRELADLAGHPDWMRDAESLEFLGESTSGVGTRMRVPTRIGPFRTLDILEVVGWEKNEAIAVSHEGLVSGTGEFRLHGSNPTVVVWTEELRFPWWLGGALVAFVARPVLQYVWAGNLRRLARVIEA